MPKRTAPAQVLAVLPSTCLPACLPACHGSSRQSASPDGRTDCTRVPPPPPPPSLQADVFELGVSTIELAQPNPSQSVWGHMVHSLQALAESTAAALKPGSVLRKAVPGSRRLQNWHIQQWCLGGGWHALLNELSPDIVSMPCGEAVPEGCFPPLMGKAWGKWLDKPLGKAESGRKTRNADALVACWKEVCETPLPERVQQAVAAAVEAEAAHLEFAEHPDFAVLAEQLYALLGWCIQWHPEHRPSMEQVYHATVAWLDDYEELVEPAFRAA
jgi:hypothetical protein